MVMYLTPLTPCCKTCNSQGNLLRCAGCKLTLYCTREHQSSDWTVHKPICLTFKKCRTRLDRAEQTLRSRPPNIFLPADVFTNGVGHFWGYYETRDYMRARRCLIAATLCIKTPDAVTLALDHAMDMLRLSRSDNMGIRNLVPAMLLRLGRDQECYDFVKWYTTTGGKSDYDWGNMSLPFLDVKDADMFGSVNDMCGKYPDLHFLVPIIVVKIRLLLSLKSCVREGLVLAIVLRKKGQLPPELIDQIRHSLIETTLRRKVRTVKSDQLVEQLLTQVDDLFEAINRANQHWWEGFQRPDEHLDALPQFYTPGSVEEMQIVLRYSFDLWLETPGAIEFIRDKIRDLFDAY